MSDLDPYDDPAVSEWLTRLRKHDETLLFIGHDVDRLDPLDVDGGERR